MIPERILGASDGLGYVYKIYRSGDVHCDRACLEVLGVSGYI